MTYTLYTAGKCKWCKLLIKYMVASNIEFNSVSLKGNRDAIKFLQEQNLYTVPQLFADNDLVGGYDNAMTYFKTIRT